MKRSEYIVFNVNPGLSSSTQSYQHSVCLLQTLSESTRQVSTLKMSTHQTPGLIHWLVDRWRLHAGMCSWFETQTVLYLSDKHHHSHVALGLVPVEVRPGPAALRLRSLLKVSLRCQELRMVSFFLVQLNSFLFLSLSVKHILWLLYESLQSLKMLTIWNKHALFSSGRLWEGVFFLSSWLPYLIYILIVLRHQWGCLISKCAVKLGGVRLRLYNKGRAIFNHQLTVWFIMIRYHLKLITFPSVWYFFKFLVITYLHFYCPHQYMFSLKLGTW